MNNYDAKSCSALAKLHYRPVDAALRWCGLIDHELKILQATGEAQFPPLGVFPQWPCLRSNIEAILDAIENGDLPHGRDGKTVIFGDHVAVARRTIRHSDLKAWMTKYHPDKKPNFLFDDVERTTHAAINADSFRALQVDRDALKTRVDKAIEVYQSLRQERDKIEGERASLAATVEKMNVPGARAETSYLNIIGGLLGLMLGKSPAGKDQSVFQNQSMVIDSMLGNYPNSPGISSSNLEKQFADANRSIKAT
jgi:hypothetical protein